MTMIIRLHLQFWIYVQEEEVGSIKKLGSALSFNAPSSCQLHAGKASPAMTSGTRRSVSKMSHIDPTTASTAAATTLV